MKNIETILSELGVELTDEQKQGIKKAVAENYKTIAEVEKKDTALAEVQKQYEEAKAALEGFNGVDVEDLKKQIAEATQKIQDNEENYKKTLAARDYHDAIRASIAGSGIKFTSKSAEKAFTQELESKGYQCDNGKIIGFDDFVAEYKENDAGAIVNEEQQTQENSKATFTTPMNNDANTTATASDAAKLRAAFGLPVNNK